MEQERWRLKRVLKLAEEGGEGEKDRSRRSCCCRDARKGKWGRIDDGSQDASPDSISVFILTRSRRKACKQEIHRPLFS
jgi:hypothetical protein